MQRNLNTWITHEGSNKSGGYYLKDRNEPHTQK